MLVKGATGVSFLVWFLMFSLTDLYTHWHYILDRVMTVPTHIPKEVGNEIKYLSNFIHIRFTHVRLTSLATVQSYMYAWAQCHWSNPDEYTLLPLSADNVATNIIYIFMAINYLLIYTLGFLYIVILVLQMHNSLDASAPGHSPWILDWTCFLWTPLCHVYIHY